MAGFRDRVSLLSRDQGGQGGHSPHSADAQPAARQILPNKPNYAGAIASMTAQSGIGELAVTGHGMAGSDILAMPEDNRLLVGRNIHLKGEIGSCDTLVVEGRVEAAMKSRIIQTAESGVFIGEAEVETAEIHGRFEGKLTANKRLVVHATGRVTGTVRYGSIIIEEGGRIAGDIAEIGDGKPETRQVLEMVLDAS